MINRQIEVGDKLKPRNVDASEYVLITSIDWDANEVSGRVYYTTGATVDGLWCLNGRIHYDTGEESKWDLVSVYGGRCEHAVVDTGMRWSFCRHCEVQFEFRNWEWQEARK